MWQYLLKRVHCFANAVWLHVCSSPWLIDRMHFKNHVGEFCRLHCNPES
jgi:hypothetical protein